MVVAQLGQARAFGLHGQGLLGDAALACQPLLPGQRVRDVAEGLLHGLLVVRHGQVAAHLGQGQAVLQAPAVEDRQREAGREGPGRAAAVEQATQLGAGAAQRARERNAREEGRARRADAGVGGAQQAFGLDHVRPLQERFGRHAGRDVGERRRHFGQRLRQQILGRLGADKQRQCVAVLRDDRRVACGFGKAFVQKRNGAGHKGFLQESTENLKGCQAFNQEDQPVQEIWR